MSNIEKSSKYYSSNIEFEFDNKVILNWYTKRIINKIKPESKILELGIGHGYSTNMMSSKFDDHTSIEGSSNVIKNYLSKFPHKPKKIIESYFEDFETSKKFDVIIMGFILEHVNDPVEILQKYRSYLKDDGILFAAVPNAKSLNRRVGFHAGLLDDYYKLTENDHALGHQRYYDLEKFHNDFSLSGYKILSTEGIFLKPITTGQFETLRMDDEVINGFCVAGISYPELSLGILVEAGL